jgi:hypothetical protein
MPYAEWSGPWLVAGISELVAVAAHGTHVFLARVSLASRQMVGRSHLETPEPMGAITSMTVDGDAIWLVGEKARLLCVDRTTGELRRWSSLEPLLVDGELLEHAFVLTGGVHLWWATAVPRGLSSQRVIEIDGWRRRREISSNRHPLPLFGPADPVVVGAGYEGGAVVYTERGTVREELTACIGMRVTGVTPTPTGLIILGAPTRDDDGFVEIVHLIGGRAVARLRLPDSDIDRTLKCAFSRRSGLLYVHHGVDDDGARLVTLRVSESGIEMVDTVRAATSGVLIQDTRADEVAVMWDTTAGIKVELLGTEPPRLGRAPDAPHRFLPTLAGYFSCHPHGEENATGPGGQRLEDASNAARAGDWGQVRDLLEPVPLEAVAPTAAAHHCHLLGLALLRTGAASNMAREVWRFGRAHDRVEPLSCRLDECLEIIEPLPDPIEPWSAPGAPFVHQLRAAIAGADDALSRGDARGTVQVLRRRSVTRSGEVQSLARMASAWLAIAPVDDHERFDKLLMLARFLAVADERLRDLPIEGAWDRARIDDLVSEAARWLTE